MAVLTRLDDVVQEEELEAGDDVQATPFFFYLVVRGQVRLSSHFESFVHSRMGASRPFYHVVHCDVKWGKQLRASTRHSIAFTSNSHFLAFHLHHFCTSH